MVYTLFTWRYGGLQVSLCHSFSGWIEQIPMILAEGSSNTFQRICDLPPGYHQYRFLVDGVWRIDQQQLCVQDEYGTISNIILVKEPEIVFPSLTSHAEPSQPSNIPPSPSVMTDNDKKVFRHRLCMHLSCYKAHELIPNSGKVIALDANVAVKQAFHVMYEQGLATVPLWSEDTAQFSGMLTASDFILILMELHKNRAALTDEQLDIHTISAWKDGKLKLQGEVVKAALSPYGGPLIHVGPDESLKDVVLKLMQNRISTVPILHLTEGSCSQLLHVVCLSAILKHICKQFRNHIGYLPFLQQPICNLQLGTWRSVGAASGHHLLTLSSSETLISALNLLLKAQISCIPVISNTGGFMNVYCRSDITSLARDGAYAHINLEQTTISQALELIDWEIPGRFQICSRADSLFRVMELLSDPVVRRLIVTDARSVHVEGIITLGDLFNFFLS